MKGYLTLLGVHATTGYALAVGVEGLLWGDSRLTALRGVVGWIALAGGARVLHAAFSPSPESGVSKHAMELGAGAMAVALLVSFTLPPGYRLAAAACFVLGVLYAIPPVRLGARDGWDPAAAALALGFLTPYAGFAATGKSLDLVSGLALLGFAPLAAGARALARAGAPGALPAAIWGSAAAFGCWIVAWLVRGDPWYVPAGAVPGLIGLAIAFAAWSRVVLLWRRRHESPESALPRRGLWSLGAAWIVTDAAIIAAFAW